MKTEQRDQTGNMCEVKGVGSDTYVVCSEDGERYGPDEDAREMATCPYCGADGDASDHRVHDDGNEVECPETLMSTFRYCPNCGSEAER